MRLHNTFGTLLAGTAITTAALALPAQTAEASSNVVTVDQCHFRSVKPHRSGSKIVGSVRYWCDHKGNAAGWRRAVFVSISQWDYYQGWVSRASAHNDGQFDKGVTVNVSTPCRFGRWRVVSQVKLHSIFAYRWTPGSYSDVYSANC